MQIYNIHQTLKEKSLTKPTEISVSKKILQETTFRSICEWILLHRYKKKKTTYKLNVFWFPKYKAHI